MVNFSNGVLGFDGLGWLVVAGVLYSADFIQSDSGSGGVYMSGARAGMSETAKG